MSFWSIYEGILGGIPRKKIGEIPEGIFRRILGRMSTVIFEEIFGFWKKF